MALYHLTPHQPRRDLRSVPPAELRRYRIMARDIIERWVDYMRSNPVVLQRYKCDFVAERPHTIETWLEAAAIDSGVMHDNVDANMIFDETINPYRDADTTSIADIDEWNAVTYDYGFLEAAAADVLRRMRTERKQRHRFGIHHERPGDHRIPPCVLHQDCIDNPAIGATCVRVGMRDLRRRHR